MERFDKSNLSASFDSLVRAEYRLRVSLSRHRTELHPPGASAFVSQNPPQVQNGPVGRRAAEETDLRTRAEN